MRINRVFQNINIQPGININLDARASNYLIRVLRLKSGNKLVVFNGHGEECNATISAIDKRQCIVALHEKITNTGESNLDIHLIQGIARGEKMDWIIQKAIELGVTQITPVFTQYCEVKLNAERKLKRLHHWQSIAISACEQCGRSVLPIIHPPVTLPELHAQNIQEKEQALKIVLDPLAENSLRQLSDSTKNIMLLIGPEGGLSEEEIAVAVNQGFHRIKLGPRILRTETAGLAAITAVQYQWGDLGLYTHYD